MKDERGNELMCVDNNDHADHTAWGVTPPCEDCGERGFVLTLHRANDEVFAAAAYSYEQWMMVFESLKQAKEDMDRQDAWMKRQ